MHLSRLLIHNLDRRENEATFPSKRQGLWGHEQFRNVFRIRGRNTRRPHRPRDGHSRISGFLTGILWPSAARGCCVYPGSRTGCRMWIESRWGGAYSPRTWVKVTFLAGGLRQHPQSNSPLLMVPRFEQAFVSGTAGELRISDAQLVGK